MQSISPNQISRNYYNNNNNVNTNYPNTYPNYNSLNNNPNYNGLSQQFKVPNIDLLNRSNMNINFLPQSNNNINTYSQTKESVSSINPFLGKKAMDFKFKEKESSPDASVINYLW